MEIEQVDMLEFLAEVLAVFLLKQRSRDKAVRQADNLQSILDRQEEWVYVVDPETCQLQFMNDKIRRMVPEAQLGMTCHQAFMGRSSRCEKCPIPHIGEGQGAHAVIQSDKLGVTVQAHAVAVSWNAKQSCLITSREQEKQK